MLHGLWIIMLMSLPIKLNAIYQQRVWGGRKLESVYNRELPDSVAPYGESWEISDREFEQSTVTKGEFEGLSLNQLWSEKRSEIFGDDLIGDRFPILVKILDSSTDLSIQVHPPTKMAEQLGGDAKTEMWYIADVEEGSKLYVGLKNGVTKESFRQSLQDGTVEQQVHADTTYRVFDWNRVGLNGKARDLHVEESMQCIDFSDFEPSMDEANGPRQTCISDCPYFYIDKLELKSGECLTNPQQERFSIITVVSGKIKDEAGDDYVAGDFFILPRGASSLSIAADATILQTTIPV